MADDCVMFGPYDDERLKMAAAKEFVAQMDGSPGVWFEMPGGVFAPFPMPHGGAVASLSPWRYEVFESGEVSGGDDRRQFARRKVQPEGIPV